MAPKKDPRHKAVDWKEQERIDKEWDEIEDDGYFN